MISQLHCHTEYSLLDGIVKIPDAIDFVVKNGIKFYSVTDHGNISHVPELYFACKGKGIKPIFGCEFYFKSASEPKKNYHLVLLAQNKIGLRNLIILSTKSFGENFYRKPRVDIKMLGEHSKGLICLTACRNSPIFANDGEKQLADLNRHFDGRLYLELMQSLDWNLALKYSKRFGLPYIISKDVHYLELSHREIHEAHLSSTKISLKEFDLSYTGKAGFPPAIISMAKKNLERLVESIENIELDRILKMPKVEVKVDKISYLFKRAKKKLFSKKRLDKKYLERLKYELSVFEKHDYIDYLWIVMEVCDFAASKGIFKGWGRGSGAGSLLLFGLDITEVDPIKYDLIFERFMNPDRPSVPDIDVDFEHERRDELFDFCTERFGSDKVCKIGTFHVRGQHMAFRDAGRHLGYSMTDITKILSGIDSGSEGELRRKHEKLFKMGDSLTGLKRNLSTHAAGIIISLIPLDGRIPLNRDGVSQWDMYSLEDLGWVKFDLLNSKMLTSMRLCSDLVKEYHRVDMQITKEVDTETKAKPIYDLIASGKTVGLFQFEGYHAGEVGRKIRISNFDELTAATALCRPGAFNQLDAYCSTKKTAKIDYEKLMAILAPTRGFILYDDQVMRIAGEIAGFNPVEVDDFRRAVKASSTKAKDRYGKTFEEYERKFFDGCEKNGFDPSTATKLYTQIKKFEGYGFNKNHATAYSIETFVSAALKYHFPLLWMYSLLLTADNEKAQQKYIGELKRLKFKVEGVDINKSGARYTLDYKNKSILHGLLSVKQVGESAAKMIVELRPYDGFENFLSKIRGSGLKVNVVESLIEVGAFRPEKKEGLTARLKEDRNKAKKIKKNIVSEVDLF